VGKENAIVIEAMRKEDIDQILAIEQASFTMPWSRNLFLSEFRSRNVSLLMVALREAPVRSVCAYIVCWIVADEMHILNLAVQQDMRRQGIARKLVMAALKRAHERGAKRAFLEVRASNGAARRLYGSIGFSGTSVRRDYYDEPLEDAVIMTLEQGAFESAAKVA
jgi:ribosomal-protein-alanine N-acetyltransferase